MPTIIPSTQCLVAPAYSPIIWRIREYTISGVLPPVMRVKFFLDGGVTAIYDTQVTHIESSQAPPTYFFEVNAQEIFASAISNLESLPDAGVSFLTTPIHQVHITITPLLDSGAGYLVEDPGATITSPPAGMINAYRFSNEAICLDNFATAAALLGSDGVREWLTRRPLHEEVCFEHPFYLSGLTEVALKYRFSTYDEPGNLIAEDYWTPSPATANQVVIMDVSPTGIAALDAGGWDVAGVVIDENVYRYSVRTYTIIGFLVHKIFNLYPVRGCCEYQLVFLNSFGVYECMNLAQEDVMSYAVSGQLYSSARLLPSEANYMMSRGDGYLYKEGRNVFQFALPQSRDAYQDFYRDMMNSSDVYLRFGGELVPVTMNAATVNLRSNFGVVVTLSWSNTDRSQGN